MQPRTHPYFCFLPEKSNNFTEGVQHILYIVLPPIETKKNTISSHDIYYECMLKYTCSNSYLTLLPTASLFRCCLYRVTNDWGLLLPHLNHIPIFIPESPESSIAYFVVVLVLLISGGWQICICSDILLLWPSLSYINRFTVTPQTLSHSPSTLDQLIAHSPILIV